MDFQAIAKSQGTTQDTRMIGLLYKHHNASPYCTILRATLVKRVHETLRSSFELLHAFPTFESFECGFSNACNSFVEDSFVLPVQIVHS